MVSSAKYHLIVDNGNMTTQSPYRDTNEIIVGNGNFVPISSHGSSAATLNHLPYAFNHILHALSIHHNLLLVFAFTNNNNVSIEFFLDMFLVKDICMKHILYQGQIAFPDDSYIISNC